MSTQYVLNVTSTYLWFCVPNKKFFTEEKKQKQKLPRCPYSVSRSKS